MSSSLEVRAEQASGSTKEVPSEPSPMSPTAKSNLRLAPSDFEFGRLLGEGAYAKVYEATRKATGKMYAIKMVDKQFVTRYKKIATVHNERNVLSILNHVGVIKLYFTFQDAYSLYFVLDYAEGGELHEQIVRRGKLPVSSARFYAAELLTIIIYMHQKNVIHRDLKPTNILLSLTGHVKLTDFGTSKIMSPVTSMLKESTEYSTTSSSSASSPPPSGHAEVQRRASLSREEWEKETRKRNESQSRRNSFVGTAHYVPPELLNDQPVSINADYWAFGVILYEMLTGTVPFKGDSEYLTFQKILKGNISWPEDMDTEAIDLISKLLALDPDQRLGIVAEDGEKIQKHPFFSKFQNTDDEKGMCSIDFENIYTMEAPALMPLEEDQDTADHKLNKAKWHSSESNDADNLDEDIQAMKLQGLGKDELETSSIRLSGGSETGSAVDWTRFLLDGESVVFQGLVQKSGTFGNLFAKSRRMLLTSFPRFVYISENSMQVRGEIAWSNEIWAEYKDDLHFDIHTPGRTYIIKVLDKGRATSWVQAITNMQKHLHNK